MKFRYHDDSLTLHTDLYQINMMKTYWETGLHEKKAIFEAYFRKLPFENGYAIFAGLERLVHYIEDLTFSQTDLEYLRSLDIYPEEFLDYLKNFKFKGNIHSAVEGELVFANEPLVQVEGTLAECQLIETALLNIINFQTLIATKASRIRTVAGDDPVLEFGTRRAQELDAALWGNAIRVAKEFGDKINFLGVRIDSGDMAYMSKKVRQQLDDAGFTEAKIYASSDLDEKTVLNLKMQGAKIDVWGIGTRLITAYDQPALGCVYKLVAIEDENGEMVPTVKISNNAEKVSTPGKKQVWRITRKSDGKSEGDYIALWHERPDELEELYMFHPVYTYINKTVTDFDARPILQSIFEQGKLVYTLPSLKEIKAYKDEQVEALWDEYKRILNPEQYPVDLSTETYQQKLASIEAIRAEVKEKMNRLS